MDNPDISWEVADQILACAKLPDKLSDLLDCAVDHLEENERSPNIVIEMGEWFTRPWRMEVEGEEVVKECAVCLAGGVLVGCVPAELPALEPMDLPLRHPLGRKLRALNLLRTGAIRMALCALGVVPGPNADRVLRDIPVPCSYSHSPTQFKAAMRQLAATLRGLGV